MLLNYPVQSLMGQSVNGNIQSKLLTIVRADAFALVASVIRAKGTAEAVLAHDRNEIPFIEEAFELDITRFVEAANALDLIKGTIDDMIVRNRFDSLVRENAAEFATPRCRKIGIGATAGSEEKATVAEVHS